MVPKKRKSASGSDAKAKAAKLPDGGDSDKSQWIRQLTAWYDETVLSNGGPAAYLTSKYADEADWNWPACIDLW
ncbi:unnamed protein product [Durusdinium trenchii]|uniref:Uncharacterized protein n=2 Tax=Durusdinium trenchii TaxID=1381693 RepID=A0ABP0I022_9DINO